MTKFILLSCVLLITLNVGADRLVRIHDISQTTVFSFIEQNYDVANVDIENSYVDLMVPDEEANALLLTYPHVKVLPREWGELLPENAKNAGYYYSPGENWEFWCTLAEDYSDLADTPVVVGQSHQSRDIYTIRITSSVGDADYKPVMYFSSLIHAREPGSNSVIIDFANWLCTNYDSDTRATWILDNTQVYFMPVANPDGYEYNMPGGGDWRKNRNGAGIDLNRNWGYMWGYDDQGSSPYSWSETYRGTAPFSEAETQVQRDFIISIEPIAAMNYHTYGGYLLYPWGYENIPTPHQSTFESWGAAMTQYNGYQYGRAEQILYAVNGEQNDWCYSGDSVPTILAMTPEVDDNGFWGGQNDSTLIADFCEECRYMNIWLCMTAPGFVGVEEQSWTSAGSPLEITALWPNPALSRVGFRLTVPMGTTVEELVVFDITGRTVAEISIDDLQSGQNMINWSIPETVPAGIYTVRASDNSGQVVSKRFTILE